MKWLLLILFQLEAVKAKTASSLNDCAVMFWSWELLWRRLWNFHAFCPHLIKIERPDSSLPTGRRQVQTFSDFIIFVACLLILLASMLYGLLKQHSTSLTSVPISEASWGKLWDINIHDSFMPHIHLKRCDLGNRMASLPSVMCLIYRWDKAKHFLFPFAAFHSPSAQMLVYSRCGRKHPCVYKDFQPHNLLLVSPWASPVRSLNFFLQPEHNYHFFSCSNW